MSRRVAVVVVTYDAEPWVFLLNADAWVLGDGLARLVEFGDAHPGAALVGPRLVNPDGTLQRSARGFPTPWRLATEFFFPGAEVVHVGGGATRRDWGAMFATQVRSHVRFVRKHQGASAAAAARALLVVSLALRGLAFRGERGRSYRQAARGLLR